MEPNNNMPEGTPGVSNDAFGGTEQPQQFQQPQSEAVVEMQAAMVADQIANPAPAPKIEDNPMVEAAKAQKKAGAGKNALIAAVVFALLAVGGVGFGVWAMMDGQAQKEKIEKDLKSQISSLKQSNEELQTKLDEAGSNNDNTSNNNGGDTIINIDTNTLTTNPVVSATSPESYRTSFSYSGLSISLVDGIIAYCNYNDEATCSVEGLSGKIYKMNYLAVGNGINGSERFAFLMEDGSVFGVSPDERSDSGAFVAKKLNIGGFVKDIIEADYTADVDNPTGWIKRTVFVMNDNSIMGYSESML